MVNSPMYMEANDKTNPFDKKASMTRLTKLVATKVSSEVYDAILAIAHCNGVTTSCAVRNLIVRALCEVDGNLIAFDSRQRRDIGNTRVDQMTER